MRIDLQEDLAPEAAALQDLAVELVAAALATRESEALLVRAQAALLAWLSAGDRTADGGYSRLSDLVLATIGMSARTVRERLRLHRLFRQVPGLEDAFVRGEVSLCQIGAAAPILQSIEEGDRESAAKWIAIAGRVSVRTMRREVRIQKERGLLKTEPEGEGQRVSFRAPVGFRIAWEKAIDLARKQIGGDAAIHACVSAILAESGWAGLGPKPPQSRIERERGIDVRPRRRVPDNPEAVAHARETLRQTFAAIEDVKDLVASGEPRSTHEAIEALRQIERLRAPHQVLFCHLIRDLRATYAMDLLGYRSMAEMVEDLFGLSERSARNRVAESLLFESSREIEAAFGRGEISLMQAHLIQKLAAGARVGPFIGRAREVTWRQLQREARILDLLRMCGLGGVSRRPLPDARIEEALVEALGGDAAPRAGSPASARRRIERSGGELHPHGATRSPGRDLRAHPVGGDPRHHRRAGAANVSRGAAGDHHLLLGSRCRGPRLSPRRRQDPLPRPPSGRRLGGGGADPLRRGGGVAAAGPEAQAGGRQDLRARQLPVHRAGLLEPQPSGGSPQPVPVAGGQ